MYNEDDSAEITRNFEMSLGHVFSERDDDCGS
jgi:hypothetical protein